MSRYCRTLLVALSLSGPAVSNLSADNVNANFALQQGQVEKASSLLKLWIAEHPADAQAHLLLCRVFYAQEMANAAVSECEAAATAAPDVSELQLWLGRTYGMKASSASPLVAFSIARKARDTFERAVRLNPSNIVALGDLGEFYVKAPSIVGGGIDKARQLAARLRSVNLPPFQAESHRILALAAEKENNFSEAEMEFRQATAGNLPAAWIDLGAFYARHRQLDLAASAIRTAIRLDRSRGATLVDAASVLTEANRSPELARQLLGEYIASPNTSDAAPVFKVHLQLGDLLARSGDLASARKEYSLAVTMAPNFPPARKSRDSS